MTEAARYSAARPVLTSEIGITPKTLGFLYKIAYSYLRRCQMDTRKWKSILVPREVYEEVVKISHAEGRTISGQLRVIFSQWYMALYNGNAKEDL